MHRRLYAPLFLCFAAVSACESPSYINPVPTPEPPSPPVAAAEFAAAYAKASCDRFVRCDNAAPYLAEQCLQNALDFLGEDVEAAIAAGRIVYNDAEAGKCVAGIADTRCLDQEPSDETIASCLAGLQGTVAAGQPCYSPFECAAGFCPSVSKDACPALCPEVAGEGEACSFLSGPDCDVRLGLRCSVGVCVLPRGEDAACVDNQGCKSGFVCVTGVCEPLRGEDFGCARDSSCADGLFCIAEGDDGGICEKRLGEGSVCGVNPEEHLAAFRGVQCQEGLVCKGAGLNAEGTAIPGVCAKPVGEGEACVVEPVDLQLHLSGCLEGLLCVGGACEVPPVSGACPLHGYCKPGGAYCDAMSLMCVALKGEGEACVEHFECGSGACVASVCGGELGYCEM